jgi:hypothetical protein
MTVKLDGKYKTTSFFEVKLLKCPFEEKNQFKNDPKSAIVLEKKNKKTKKKKKKNGGDQFFST